MRVGSSAAAPSALPGFVPPKRGEAMWLPEMSVPGVLEHLALTGLGLPARRWEQDVLLDQGTTGPRYVDQAAQPATELNVGMWYLARIGLPPERDTP